jgi:hypothetical protein
MIDVMFTFVDREDIGRFIDARVAVLPRQGDRVKIERIMGTVETVTHEIGFIHVIEINLVDIIYTEM